MNLNVCNLRRDPSSVRQRFIRSGALTIAPIGVNFSLLRQALAWLCVCVTNQWLGRLVSGAASAHTATFYGLASAAAADRPGD